jgi:hypothetical protein
MWRWCWCWRRRRRRGLSAGCRVVEMSGTRIFVGVGGHFLGWEEREQGRFHIYFVWAGKSNDIWSNRLIVIWAWPGNFSDHLFQFGRLYNTCLYASEHQQF